MEASNIEPPRALLLDDFWFILANYIAPEDVQRYALICVKSAKSVNRRAFWANLHRHYYLVPPNILNDVYWHLPEYLQIEHLNHCDKDELKRRVIRILHRRYPRLSVRLNEYSLDTLVGRTYITSWSGDYNDRLLYWYLLFKLNYPLTDTNSIITSYPLKTLDCPYKSESCECSQNNDGIKGLHIRCSSDGINFPEDVLTNKRDPHRLTAIREVNDKLELDFVSSNGLSFVSATFSNVSEYKVIPWWHPTFRVFE